MPRVSTGARILMQDRYWNGTGAAVGGVHDTGMLRVYSGTRPADADAAPTGTLLAELPLAADSMSAAAVNGANVRVALAAAIQDAAANAAGTIGWCRLSDSADAGGISTTEPRWDFTATATSGGGEIEFNNTNVAVGQNVQVTALNIDLPVGT